MADDSSTVGSSGPLAFSPSGDQTKLANAATVEVGSVVVGDDQDLVIVMLIQLFEGSCKHILRSCMWNLGILIREAIRPLKKSVSRRTR